MAWNSFDSLLGIGTQPSGLVSSGWEPWNSFDSLLGIGTKTLGLSRYRSEPWNSFDSFLGIGTSMQDSQEVATNPGIVLIPF